MPGYGTRNLELIGRVFLMELRNLLRSESILKISLESSCHIRIREEEWVTVEWAGHCGVT